MTSASFTRICRTVFGTERPPAVSGGKGGVPATHLTDKRCTDPIQPGNAAELMQSLNLESRYQLYEIRTAETDIKQNPPDVIVIGSEKFPVVIVEPRTIPVGETRTRVVYKKLVR